MVYCIGLFVGMAVDGFMNVVYHGMEQGEQIQSALLLAFRRVQVVFQFLDLGFEVLIGLLIHFNRHHFHLADLFHMFLDVCVAFIKHFKQLGTGRLDGGVQSLVFLAGCKNPLQNVVGDCNRHQVFRRFLRRGIFLRVLYHR